MKKLWIVLFVFLIAGCATEDGLNPVLERVGSVAGSPPVRDDSRVAEPVDEPVAEPVDEPVDDPTDPPDEGCAIKLIGEQDLGQATGISRIGGSPHGYLASRYDYSNENAYIRTFDPQGNAYGAETILPDSDQGVHLVVGTDTGYVLTSEDWSVDAIGRVTKLSPTGELERMNVVWSSPRFGTPVQGGTLIGMAAVSWYDNQPTTYYEVTFVSKSGLLGATQIALLTNEHSPGMVGLAAIGDTYAFGRSQDLDLDDETHDLRLVIRRKDGFTQTVLAEGDAYQSYILDVLALGDRYAVVWVQAGQRYLTYVEVDGTLGSTYLMAGQPETLRDLAVSGDGFVATFYDEFHLRLSVARLNQYGQLIGDPTILAEEIKLYYLGSPQIATAGENQFAVIRVEESVGEAVVSFLTCE